MAVLNILTSRRVSPRSRRRNHPHYSSCTKRLPSTIKKRKTFTPRPKRKATPPRPKHKGTRKEVNYVSASEFEELLDEQDNLRLASLEEEFNNTIADMKISDELQNSWGVDFILCTSTKGRRCRTNKTEFSLDITKAVPGYHLEGTAISGTLANIDAINKATNFDFSRLLVAVGSYCGGDECMQELSTSEYSSKGRFAFPKAYEDSSLKAKNQSVPAPYFIDCEALTPAFRAAYEDECLHALHRRLLVAVLAGKPYKALMLEYILGGCGAELSHRYLESLGGMLKQFNIQVIADEVLTGARVGPQMCMTTSAPAAFQDVVTYITLGKWLQCALVLVKKPMTTTLAEESLRGFSTVWNYGPTSQIFSVVAERVEKGMICAKRAEVEKMMRVENDREACWPSKGILLFTSYTRNPIMKGLKNRLLPMLEGSVVKLVKLNAKITTWNRSSVCKEVVGRVKHWLSVQSAAMESSKYVFLDAIAGYALSCSPEFRVEDIIMHIGKERMEHFASMFRQRVRESQGKKCTKSAESFLKAAIISCIYNTAKDRSVYKKRKGYQRIEYTYVQEELVTTTYSPLKQKNQ